MRWFDESFFRISSHAGHELTDEVFEHEGALRIGDLIAFFERFVGAAERKPDVLPAENTFGQDLRAGIGRQFRLHPLVDRHRDDGLTVVWVDIDARDTADSHAGNTDL